MRRRVGDGDGLELFAFGWAVEHEGGRAARFQGGDHAVVPSPNVTEADGTAGVEDEGMKESPSGS